jgi:DNA-binding MarR family transcriptional regulator
MGKTTQSVSGYDLFLLLGQISHFTQLVRRREMGVNATLSEVAKHADRKINAICRQSIIMERDGLIQRIKDTPKSRLLRMELTDKGREMLKISKESKSINALYSVLDAEELQQAHDSLTKLFNKLKEGIDG